MAEIQTTAQVVANEADKAKAATPVQSTTPEQPVKVEPAIVPQTKA